MFDTDLDVLVWAGLFHGGFLILLLLCLLLHCCSCWPRTHHRRVQLARDVRNRIRAVVESRMEDLRAAVKKVVVARLDDGKPRGDMFLKSMCHSKDRWSSVTRRKGPRATCSYWPRACWTR